MKILHLISSPRGDASMSIKLGNAIIEKLRTENPLSSVTTHNLAKTAFPHLEQEHLDSFFTPLENLTPELSEAIKHSDGAIAELKAADVIVIGVPMYNFSIHSTLKAWIDHVARAGKTFRYTENGPQGLIKDKTVYLAIASGGVYSGGPMKAYDFTEPYLKTVLGFLGMKHIIAFRVEGLSTADVKDNAWNKALQSIEDEFTSFRKAA